MTHLVSQTYVWYGCKWNFAGAQIYLQPANIKSQHFEVSLKFWVVIESIAYMKTKCVSEFFISSVFSSDSQCPKFRIYRNINT